MIFGNVIDIYIDDLLNEYADSNIAAEELEIGNFNPGRTFEFTATND